MIMAKSFYSHLFLILQIHLSQCSFDSSFTITSDFTDDSEIFGGSFSLNNYSWWLRDHRIKLVNYLVKVNDTVTIRSPIDPVPKGLHWLSLKMESEAPALKSSNLVGMAYSHFFEKFAKTHNRSWTETFDLDRKNRWLKIRNVQLNFTDVFRIYVDAVGSSSDYKDAQDFDVAINLVVYANHECGFQSRPITPRRGDAVILHCSAVVSSRLWRPSFVFKNLNDGSTIEIKATKICGYQPNVGFKACASARVVVQADTPVLAYSCQLHFAEEHRKNPRIPAFNNSKWTTRFQQRSMCYLPMLYIDVIPSDVSFLCNGIPCGETIRVGQAITCHAHGYPQPDFTLEVFRTPLSMPSERLKRMIDSVEALENFLDEGGAGRPSDRGHVKDILQFIIRMISQLISDLQDNAYCDVDSEKPIVGKENLTELVLQFQVTMSKLKLNDSRLNDSFVRLEELVVVGRLNVSEILDFFDKVLQQLNMELWLKNATEKQRRLTEELYEPVVKKIKKKLKDVRKLLAKKDTGGNSTLKTKTEFWDDDEETEIRIRAVDTIADFWELVDKGADENDIKKAYENIMLDFIFPDFQLNNTELLNVVNVESKSEYVDLDASRSSGLNSSALAFNESTDAAFSKETEEMKAANSSANATDEELETLEQSTSSVNSSEHGNGPNTPVMNKGQLNTTDDINAESAIGRKDLSDEGSEEEILTDNYQQPNRGGMKDAEEYVTTESDVGHVELTCNVSNKLGWGFSSIGIDVLPSVEDVEKLTALNHSLRRIADDDDSSIRRSLATGRSGGVNRTLSRRSPHKSKAPAHRAEGEIQVPSAGDGSSGKEVSAVVGKGAKVKEEASSVALKGNRGGGSCSAKSCMLLQLLLLLFIGLCINAIEF